MKILFLGANPIDVVSRLRIDEEIREISQKMRLGTHRDHFELVSEWAVRAGDLQEALLRHQPDIVHFSGHCSPSSGIMLEDENGNRKVVKSEALADLFRILQGNTRLVVLNACHGKEQAEALATTIDFTIGMNTAIRDKDATLFAVHFYQSLAFDRSVKEAFDLALNQLELEGIDVAQAPVLLVRDGANSADSLIINPSRRTAVDDKDRRPRSPSLRVFDVSETQNMFRTYLLHALVSCVVYAGLYVEALLLEVSYDFEQYGRTALKSLPLAFSWVLVTSVVGLFLHWRRTARGHTSGLWVCLMIFLAASLVLLLLLIPALPSTAVTQARFQTHTAQAAYIKDSGLFLMLAILFIILPLHVVSSLEREINTGQAKSVLALLNGDKQSMDPYGTFYIKPRSLGIILAIITIWNLIVRAYVLDQLTPGPDMNLFMKVYYVHLFLFLALPAYCLAWYYRALNEIKRRCLEISAEC